MSKSILKTLEKAIQGYVLSKKEFRKDRSGREGDSFGNFSSKIWEKLSTARLSVGQTNVPIVIFSDFLIKPQAPNKIKFSQGVS